MRTLVFLISASLVLPAFAQQHDPACQEKLDYLEKKVGINQKALIQAFKNVKSSGLNQDYVILAKVGSGKKKHDGRIQHEGRLQILDLTKGEVTELPITHGVPENSGAAEDQNLAKGKYTFFGGMQVNFKESDAKAPLWRISTMAVSPTLVNNLTLKGETEEDGSSMLGQQLLSCTEKFKRTSLTENDICLKPEHFEQVKQVVQGQKTPVGLFLYPAKKADVYFKSVKLDNDAPPTCEYLSRMPNIGSPFDAPAGKKVTAPLPPSRPFDADKTKKATK